MSLEANATVHRVVVFTDDGLSEPYGAQLQGDFPHAEIVVMTATDAARLLSPIDGAPINWLGAVEWLSQGQFDAAVMLMSPGRSPYTLGYLCYLAGIPMRVGRSQEFGGQVLTHVLAPEHLIP